MKLIYNYILKYALYIAFIQAWMAVAGSLYFSEILHLPPCLLCWYQRIFMYPLVIILAVGIIRKDRNVSYYALPISLLGAVVALYHYLLQFTPAAKIALSCDAFNPCTEIQISFFGFITIPFLSFLAFGVISTMMIFLLKSKNKR